MSITLKPQFFKAALIAVMIAGMPVSHAKSPAQADKVLRVAFPAPDDGFDMVKTFNFYSGNVADVIFITYLTLHKITFLKSRVFNANRFAIQHTIGNVFN